MKSYKSDIEIARLAKLKPIQEILGNINMEDKPEYYSPIGRYMAKVKLEYLNRLKNKENGKRENPRIPAPHPRPPTRPPPWSPHSVLWKASPSSSSFSLMAFSSAFSSGGSHHHRPCPYLRPTPILLKPNSPART